MSFTVLLFFCIESLNLSPVDSDSASLDSGLLEPSSSPSSDHTPSPLPPPVSDDGGPVTQSPGLDHVDSTNAQLTTKLVRACKVHE